MGYLYIFSTILFTVYGQLVLKWKINDYGSLPAAFLDKITFLMQLFLNPWILSGFLAAFLAALSWMAAMTKFEICYAYSFIIYFFVLVFIDYIFFLMLLFLNPWILSGFLAAFLAALSWMAAMTKFEISYAYPFMSLSFVLVFIFSVFFFGDSFSIQKIAGIACIVLGIIIMK